MYLHHLTRRSIRGACLLALVAALAACGGGGSDGTPSSNPNGGGGQTDNPQPAASFTIALNNDKAVILQGTTVDVEATITRSTGYDEAVTLSLSGLPNGVSASPVIVAKGATTVTLQLTADAQAPHSLPTAASVDGKSGTLAAAQGITVTVRGTAGSVDTSFAGGTGKAIVPVDASDDYAEAVAVQSDGKVVVAGWGHTTLGYAFEVVRLDRDGTIDGTFGQNGKVVTPVGNGTAEAHAVAIQADGKIVVAGSVDEQPKGRSFAMVRYNADGSVDNAFGQQGVVIASFGSDSDEAFAIAIQADGKIVLGGHTLSATTGLDFAIERFNADGTPDATFGTQGQVVQPVRAGAVRDSVYALGLQTLGNETKIVAAGGEGDFIVARFNADGSHDAAFGSGQNFGSVIGAARAVVVDPDGQRIAFAGHVGHDWAIVQVKADGSVDNDFGAGGRVLTKLSTTNWDEAQAIVRQADGKLVVGGWVYAGNSSNGDFAVARYALDGQLDASFGSAGVTLTSMAPNTKADEAYAMTLQADDRVPTVRSILAGSANDANRDFAVTRYWH